MGLDNAGKTTLLHRLRTGSVQPFPPTDRPNLETFRMPSAGSGIAFAAWDLGGHEAVRHLWEDYACDADAVVWLLSDLASFVSGASIPVDGGRSMGGHGL